MYTSIYQLFWSEQMGEVPSAVSWQAQTLKKNMNVLHGHHDIHTPSQIASGKLLNHTFG